MKKRFLALLLALTTLLSLFACAPDNTGSGSGEKPGITTEKDENGLLYVLSGETYTVVGYEGKATAVSVPATFNGKAVTQLSSDAFYGNKLITSVSLPASINSISPFALASCAKLAKIEIDAANPIYRAEANCILKGDTLVTACIGSDFSALSFTEVGEHAMYGLAMASIVLPASVKTIGRYAFAFASATSITLPEGVEEIKEAAFYFCQKVKTLSLPASLKKFATDSFAFMTALESITVAEGNAAFASKQNCLIRLSDKTLVLGCAKSTIPSDGSVTKIGSAAFAGAVALEKVTIPEAVTEIGPNAFYATALTQASFAQNRWYVSASTDTTVGTAIDTKNVLSDTGKPMTANEVVLYNARLLRDAYANMRWFTKP